MAVSGTGRAAPYAGRASMSECGGRGATFVVTHHLPHAHAHNSQRTSTAGVAAPSHARGGDGGSDANPATPRGPSDGSG
eukprot:scaffold2045_cov404-Prasinococcus_capsulatus_cf.AAC.50